MINFCDKLANNRSARRLLYFVLRNLNNLTPKKDQILFASFPDFSDNSKILFIYLLSKKPLNYHFIWAVDKKDYVIKLNQIGVDAYFQKSFIGLIQFFRSKCLIVTHGQYAGLKAKNQLLIDLWHGTPLKAMAYASEISKESELLEVENSSKAHDILIATSMAARNSLAACFHIDPKKIQITGQPRNDMLFSQDAKEKLSRLLKIDLNKFEKIVLFCPTFRKWNTVCPERAEGKPRTSNIFGFNDYNIQEFDQILNSFKILFLFKLHQLEESFYEPMFSEIYKSKSNIKLINIDMLRDNLIDLYEFLGAIDILITDYSSIYFDFLLLNHPIIFVTTDLEEYSKTRGFILEPYEFWTPGPKVTTFKDFIEELITCIKNPKYYENERFAVNNIINRYQDDRSCERVWNAIEDIAQREK